MIYFFQMILADIGEFGLIEQIQKITGHCSDLILGIGDDAAAWQNEGGITLAATDSLIEGIHFEWNFSNWHDLGWKSLAANLSDIAAVGGKPRVALVALAMPKTTLIENVLNFYKGMSELGKAFNVAIGGGNISDSPQVNITLTVIGYTENSAGLLTRSGAIPGEKIAITGAPGSAAAGLRLLHEKPGLSDKSARQLVQCFLKPYPRLIEGLLLAEEGVKTAIDTSDGLIADLRHILKASRVSAIIDTDKLPVAPLVEASFTYTQALGLALTGGEDYELLFTADDATIQEITGRLKTPVTVIGEIIQLQPESVKLTGKSAGCIKLKTEGWKHFA